MKVSGSSIKTQRRIAAPVEDVYEAWLDPDIVRRWLAPGDAVVSEVDVDPRAGGRFTLRQSRDGKRIGGFEATILEIVQNERIMFAWGLLGPDGLDGPVYDSILTITFHAEEEGGTTLTLVHEHLEALWAAMPDIAEQFEGGWADVLDKLEAALR